MKRFVNLLFASILSIGIISCGNKGTSSLTSDDSLKIYNKLKENAVLQVKFDSPGFPGGRLIEKKDADSMISRFRREFSPGTSPMQGIGGNLHGFYISRTAFDTLLKNKSFSGVMAYFAKPDKAAKNVYTLVFVPTIMNEATRQGADRPDSGVWEEIDPCPDRCGHTEDQFGEHPPKQ